MREVLSAKTVTCVLLTLGMVLLTGCGGEKSESAAPATAGSAAAEKVAETIIEQSAKAQGEDVDVDIDSASGAMTISVQNEDGTQDVVTGGGAQLPKGFPEDVPVYPGLNIQMSNSMTSENVFSIVGQTTAKNDDVAAFYKKELAARGWKEESVMQQNAEGQVMTMLHYGKDTRKVHVMVMSEGDATTVSLTTGEEE